MRSFSVDLPWPPTVNHYWQHSTRYSSKRGANVVSARLTRAARDYRWQVMALIGRRAQKFPGPVRVELTYYPPDRKTRDGDNLPKGILDALKYAGIYADDSQVRAMAWEFGGLYPGGAVAVRITELAASPRPRIELK